MNIFKHALVDAGITKSDHQGKTRKTKGKRATEPPTTSDKVNGSFEPRNGRRNSTKRSFLFSYLIESFY